jgi:hypothetical protein
MLDFDTVFEQRIADALARLGLQHCALRAQFDVRQNNDLRHRKFRSSYMCGAATGARPVILSRDEEG